MELRRQRMRVWIAVIEEAQPHVVGSKFDVLDHVCGLLLVLTKTTEDHLL